MAEKYWNPRKAEVESSATYCTENKSKNTTQECQKITLSKRYNKNKITWNEIKLD